jgi:hypothetical protein
MIPNRFLPLLFIIPAILWITPPPAAGAVYEVGPGKKLQSIGEVPWQSLIPGDRVAISWRPEAYREKWVISGRGTEACPIVVGGVAGPDGQLPQIDGENAVTAKSPAYWGGARSVVKIGGSEGTKDAPPAWIVLENLDIRGGRPPFEFAGPKGVEKYAVPAAAVWIENGDHITVRGCTIHDCANGLFTSNQSRNIVIERCHFYDNGLEKNIHTHSIYTESNGITFQYNLLGPLRAGCIGNNLKDRSAGLVVRYNWIEGGGRNLDLVDADDSPALRAEPAYRKTFVYGNVLIKNQTDSGIQIVHYGGDMGKPDTYRKGTLYFYNNTVVSKRKDKTTLFRLQTQDEHVDCRNNILYVTGAPKSLALLDSVGQLDLANNWIKSGWRDSSGKLTGTINAAGTISGKAPGFVNEADVDFHLTAQSPCRNAGTPLLADLPAACRVLNEYAAPQSSKPRSSAADLGAFGF